MLTGAILALSAWFYGKLLLGGVAEKTAVDSVEEEWGREVICIFLKKILFFLLQGK